GGVAARDGDVENEALSRARRSGHTHNLAEGQTRNILGGNRGKAVPLTAAHVVLGPTSVVRVVSLVRVEAGDQSLLLRRGLRRETGSHVVVVQLPTFVAAPVVEAVGRLLERGCGVDRRSWADHGTVPAVDHGDHDEERGDPPHTRNEQRKSQPPEPTQQRYEEGSYQPGRRPELDSFTGLAVRSSVGAEPREGKPDESAKAMQDQHADKGEDAARA